MLFLLHPGQGPGLGQMANISESYLALVAGVGDTLLVQSAESKDLGWIVQSVMESRQGLKTCKQCLGDCVIWEESIDERPWEKAHSSSPFKVKEDDEVDKLDIKLDVTRKSKRVYQSPSPEVGLKISRSLRSLNAKTGLFSKRMKILHRDPMLHAQRVAAIRRAKGTAAARKKASETMKAFFRDPENRLRRSMSMKGVKFYCSNCGEGGHRRHYCPALKDVMGGRFKFRCRLCGERGHNQRTCTISRSSEPKRRKRYPRHGHHCRICGQSGHNSRTCPQGISMKGASSTSKKSLPTSCCLSGEMGHNQSTCPKSGSGESKHSSKGPKHHHHCTVCGQSGHNCRTCPRVTGMKHSSSTPK